MIEKVFLQNIDSVINLADELFISVSTVKRIVTRINKELQLEGFTINLKKMQLIGDPQSICHFMDYYFLEKYHTAEQALSAKQVNILDTVLLAIFEEAMPEYLINSTNFDFKNRLRISAYTVIALVTKNAQNQLPKAPEKEFSFLSSKHICAEFYSQFHLKLTPEIISNILFLFFNEQYAHTISDLLTLTKQDYKKKQKYDKLCALLKKIEMHAHLQFEHSDNLLLRLYNLDNEVHGRTFILDDQNKNFYLNVEKMYGSILQELAHEFQVIFFESPYKEYLVYKAINLLLTDCPKLFDSLEQAIPKIKAGVFLTATSEYTELIAHKVNKELHGRYDCTPLNVSSIEELTQISAAFDCIITNIPDIHLPGTIVVVTPIILDRNSINKLTLVHEEFSHMH